MPDDYLVIYSGFLGAVCLIVRANSSEEAIEKAKQDYPIDEQNPPTIKAELLDYILANSDDVIELVRYIE
jgi:hypothetical protein